MSRKFSRVESSGDLLGFLDRGHLANRENRWTFEVAWEAANKVSEGQGRCNDLSCVVGLVQLSAGG